MIEELISQVRAELERLDRMEAEVVRRQIDLAAERSRLEQTATALASREEFLTTSGLSGPGSGGAIPKGSVDDDYNLRGTSSDGSWGQPTAGPSTGGYSELMGQVSPENDALDHRNQEHEDSQSPNDEAPVGDQIQTGVRGATSHSADGYAQQRSVGGLVSGTDLRDPLQVGGRCVSSDCGTSTHTSREAAAEGDWDHEVMIQDYLARLLGKPVPQRMSDVNQIHKNRVSGTQRQTGTTPSSECTSGAAPSQRLAPPSRQRGMTRRNPRPPEKNTNFAAMRELANLAAQAAIDRYAKAKLYPLRRNKLMIVLLSFGCCLGLCGLDLWLGIGLPGRAVMVLSFIVMLVYAIQYGLLTGRLVINPKGQLQLAERRIGREMRKLIPADRPPLAEVSEAAGGQGENPVGNST